MGDEDIFQDLLATDDMLELEDDELALALSMSCSNEPAHVATSGAPALAGSTGALAVDGSAAGPSETASMPASGLDELGATPGVEALAGSTGVGGGAVARPAAGPSDAVSMQASRLDGLLQRIRRWMAGEVDGLSLERGEADMLLRSRDVATDVIPTRRQANYIKAPPCIYFVPPPGPVDGIAFNEDSWEHKMRPSGDGGSIKDSATPSAPPFKSSYNEHEGIVKDTATLEKSHEETSFPLAEQLSGKVSIVMYRIVKLPGHPDWDSDEGSQAKRKRKVGEGSSSSSRPRDRHYKLLDPSWKLICVSSRSEAKSTPVPQGGAVVVHSQPPHSEESPKDGKFKRLDAETLFINGRGIRDIIRDMLREQANDNAPAQSSSQSSSDTVPLSSHQADLAEWMERLHPDERLRPPQMWAGHAVWYGGRMPVCEDHNKNIPNLDRITGAPGATLFVISTAPAFVGNMPEAANSRKLGEVVAMLGRVPVRVAGKAPNNSYLVPSGESDGLARAIPLSELQASANLRAQCFGVVWKQLTPDDDGTRRVLMFVAAHPSLPAFGELPVDILEEATINHERLKLRSYQQQCYERALQQNTIICLPTGKGKTLVAVRILETYLIDESDKKALFIVPTRALVEQQAQYCRDHIDPSPIVAELCGNKLEAWTRRDWERCLTSSDVLLGTPEVFKNALTQHGFLSLPQFSLMIFDEAHNATGNSPMAAIMRDAFQPRVRAGEIVPRVIGLTASYVSGALTNITKKREQLETLMHSSLFSPPALDLESLDEDSPTLIKVDYAADEIDGIKQVADGKVQELIQSFSELGRPGVVHDAGKVASHAMHVLEQVGMSGFTFYLSESVAYQLQAHAEEMAFREGDPACQRKAKELSATLPAIREACRSKAHALSRTGELTMAPFISGKCLRLLNLIEELFARHHSNEQYRGIIFVEQVALTFPLAHVLNHHLKKVRASHGLSDTVCANAVSGTGTMSDKARRHALDQFKRGRSRVLVCTASLEEGIDVKECEFVVRFSLFKTTKAHIQGSGRARHKESEVYYFDNEPDREVELAKTLSLSARDDSLRLTDEERIRRILENERRIPGVHPFQPPGFDIAVTIYNCADIVSTFISKVYGSSVNLEEFMTFNAMHQKDGSTLQTSMQYPSAMGLVTVTLKDVNRYWGDHDVSHVVDSERTKNMTRHELERKRFLFVVAVDMHQRGTLDQSNLPTPSAIIGARAMMASNPAAEAPPMAMAAKGGVHLRDVFAPDSLEGASGSRFKGSRPESSQGMPPNPSTRPQLKAPSPVDLPMPSTLLKSRPPQSSSEPTSMAPTMADYKSQLNAKANALWKSPAVTYEYDRVGEQLYRSRVLLKKLPNHPPLEGSIESGKAAAAQSAANAALQWLNKNGQ